MKNRLEKHFIHMKIVSFVFAIIIFFTMNMILDLGINILSDFRGILTIILIGLINYVMITIAVFIHEEK